MQATLASKASPPAPPFALPPAPEIIPLLVTVIEPTNPALMRTASSPTPVAPISTPELITISFG